MRLQYAIYAAALVGVVASAITGFASADVIAGPAMFWFDVVAVVFGVRASRHPGLDPSSRNATRVLTAGLMLTFAVSLVFSVTGTEAFPQPGDGFHLVATLVFFAALLLVPLPATSRRVRWKTLLDTGTVVLGASMVLWYLVIGPALNDPSVSGGLLLAAACYPVVDLLVLFALARVLLRGTGAMPRRAAGLLGGGILALLVGDAYVGYHQAQEAVVNRSTFEFACWLTTHFLLACATIELWRGAGRPHTTTDTLRRGIAGKLPYLAVGAGYALMATAAVRERQAYPWAGLVLGGIGITGLVVLRQVLAQNESTEAAETDTLTRIANRARLHQELGRALRRVARTEQSIAVLLVDLNGFKRINDTLGHQIGDELLVAVAGAMRRCLRQDDLVGRLGGDEFAVILQSVTDEAGALNVARRMADAIAGPFVVGDRPMSASASIGVAVSEPGELSVDALLHRADVAMYDTKRGLRKDDGLETDLAKAIEKAQLCLSYWPVRSLAGDVVGVEAVLGWEHPKRGPIAPEDFLPIAERIGLADQFGSWALHRAIADTAGTGRYVIVAVTARQVRQSRFVTEVVEALADNGLDGRELVLVVPEATLSGDLAELRGLGVRVALRDFGTAYESLQRLPDLPVDLLKVDGHPKDAAVVEALVRLNRALGLATILGDVEVPADAGVGQNAERG
jgi:diguanylate cyclase (GGDEF)-like protein